ncbi:MAG TPA: menaquinone biosynthesis protein [Chitinophagaceae bacterium]|nr:menaquinone biosynthesis protein [Chitinophagaceae bacterium]
MNKIKCGAVSYLNTKPLVYGFQQGLMSNSVELTEDYPSRIAAMLLNDEIDLGLVPVAIIPALKEHYIIGDYCIGADGEVASVCLFSDVPITEVKEVLLDYQSRTSVRLARILLKEYWKVTPMLTDAKADFREHINGTTAGLVIGDRAFEQRKVSAYVYDLGKAWKDLTGLPFVFAAWISNKKLTDDFKIAFNAATAAGMQAIDEIVAQNPYPLFDLKKYFTKHISYTLDDKKREGLNLFLEKLKTLDKNC